METKETVAVWLIAIDGDFAGEILLQQRAETQTVSGVEKPQSNPDICQPTWNGKVDGGEKLIDAIEREAIEELGRNFVCSFDLSKLIPFGAEHFSTGETRYIGHNFIGLATQEQLNLAKLHSGAKSGFITIGTDGIPDLKAQTDPSANPKEGIVLFEDQYRFLINLFNSKRLLAILR